MSTNLFASSSLLMFLFIYPFLSHVHVASSFTSSSSSSSSDAFCSTTPYPETCLSKLPQNKSTNIYDYGRISIQTSLSTSINLLGAVNSYVNSGELPSQTATFALQDCQHLLGLNIDMLSNIVQTIRNTDSLESSLYEDFDTQLCAVITYKETCLNGLEAVPSASSIAYDLSPSLSDGSKLCSISLALFKNGWAPSTQAPRFLGQSFPFHNGRKLLQSGGGVPQIFQTVVVNPDGSGHYTNISAAIAAAPNNTKAGIGYYQIQVAAGVYQEYISISSKQKYLMIVGAGINQTIITGNQSVGGGSTTFNSATFAVEGLGFIGVNFTIQNTAGPENYQAVALRNDADTSTFYNCSFEGYQDTLYAHSMRQFYSQCDVYGTIDYIFGNAAVVLQACNLYSRLPLQGQFNTITAQGKTDPNQDTGTSIHDCQILAASDLVPYINTTQTYLGRPWENFSTTVYMESFMDSLINPAGWSEWSGTEFLTTLFYGEFNNSGPGSNTSERVMWTGYHILNGSEALNFTVSNFIDGDSWLPPTGVPYIGGLLYYP